MANLLLVLTFIKMQKCILNVAALRLHKSLEVLLNMRPYKFHRYFDASQL